MKTKISKSICAIIIALFTIQFSSFGQSYWQLNGNPDLIPPANALFLNGNFFGSAQTSSIQFGTGGNTYMFIGGTIIPAYNGLVGIGNGFVTPAFQLDVSGITLPNGSLFRTTGNNTYDCDWEAWIQTGTGTPALYGRVYVPANTTDFAMEASKGSLEFNTGGANERMCITSKGNVIIYNSVVLKASDGNTYYRLTVNSKGELKITKVDEQTI